MDSDTKNRKPQHAAIVRVTHWVSAIGTLALIVSGVAVLLAHPRLYWGETGAVGAPALIDLPIPFLLGHSGWGRYLHFLAAWVCVASGTLYLVGGVLTRHFYRNLVPSAADLAWANVSRALFDHLRLKLSRHAETASYNVLQRLAYLTVVFLLGPLVLLSGLAFSPALASVMPALVTMLGGQQSARTIHFFAGAAIVLFLIVHVVMVGLTGFRVRMRAMITGHPGGTEEIPPLPLVSGHALFATYAALTAQRFPLRALALVVLSQVMYTKVFASGGWKSMLGGLAVAGIVAAIRRPIDRNPANRIGLD